LPAQHFAVDHEIDRLRLEKFDAACAGGRDLRVVHVAAAEDLRERRQQGSPIHAAAHHDV